MRRSEESLSARWGQEIIGALPLGVCFSAGRSSFWWRGAEAMECGLEFDVESSEEISKPSIERSRFGRALKGRSLREPKQNRTPGSGNGMGAAPDS